MLSLSTMLKTGSSRSAQDRICRRGYLSLASIKGVKINQAFKQREQIAPLGDIPVNGDYSSVSSKKI